MRVSVVGVVLVLLFAGCGEKETFTRASDFEGEYYYMTDQASCAPVSIYSDGQVRGFCGTGSKVECADGSCSLMCLDFLRSDTTALFSIADMRYAKGWRESVGDEPAADHLYVGPYLPKGLSVEEKLELALDTRTLRFYLYFDRFDCEYAIKAGADTEPEG